jgi:hypothetical protein
MRPMDEDPAFAAKVLRALIRGAGQYRRGRD